MKKNLKTTSLFAVLALLCLSLFGCGKNSGVPRLPDGSPAQVTNTGSLGDAVTWTLYSEGTLIVEGSDEMSNATFNISSPIAPFADRIVKIEIRPGVTSVGDYAFADCVNLTEISIPDTVTRIGSSALKNCYSLKSVSAPDSVTEIGDGAFLFCRALETVRLPQTVSSFGRGVFYGCESLSEIHVPEGATDLGAGGFDACDRLTAVYLPSTILRIETAGLPPMGSGVTVTYAGSAEDWAQIETEYTWAEADGRTVLTLAGAEPSAENTVTLVFAGTTPAGQ